VHYTDISICYSFNIKRITMVFPRLRAAIAKDHHVAKADAVRRLGAGASALPSPSRKESIRTPCGSPNASVRRRPARSAPNRSCATTGSPRARAWSRAKAEGWKRKDEGGRRNEEGAFRQRSCVRLISGTSTMRTPLAGGASIADTRAAFMTSSVTKPSRSALARVAGIRPSTA